MAGVDSIRLDCYRTRAQCDSCGVVEEVIEHRDGHGQPAGAGMSFTRPWRTWQSFGSWRREYTACSRVCAEALVSADLDHLYGESMPPAIPTTTGATT